MADNPTQNPVTSLDDDLQTPIITKAELVGGEYLMVLVDDGFGKLVVKKILATDFVNP